MLVVSPESGLAYSIAVIFRDFIKVLHARNGRTGLAMARERTPSIVITGMLLDDMNGIPCKISRTLKCPGS
jgi:DNA-binding response OmpR family regulator